MTTRYSRLLVAVDGSDASLHALREAFKLTSSWVTVATVAPFSERDLEFIGVPETARLLREPCDAALARAQELATEAGGVIQTVCEMGVPHERLLALAAKGNRDLIVMAPRGRSLLARVLVGSVTQRVIGFARQDVLIVPPAGAIAWDRILVATDGSPYSRMAMARALDLALTYASELYVLSVLDLPPRIRAEVPEPMTQLLRQSELDVQEIKALAGEKKIAVQGLVRAGRAYRVIVDLAREAGINLIVIGSHGRTGISRLLLGSVTERVIGQAPCPVLVVKN
jgi:nucleotide-binding universal stress UspA family protein